MYFILQPHQVETDPSGTIEVGAFNQILELDDDDTFKYSKEMIAMYFAQVPTAFAGMDAALASTDMRALADLAHFLVGSSASLGIARVAASCGRIEGAGKAGLKAAEAHEGGTPYDNAGALAELGGLLKDVKREYGDAQTWLRRWYSEHGETFDEVTAEELPEAGPSSKSTPSSKSDTNSAVDIPPLKDAVHALPPAPPPPGTAVPKIAMPTPKVSTSDSVATPTPATVKAAAANP
ncbi:signal transduction histidine kinase [Mycena galericulata]|nr:signal transduction histidine kinase [Mycena galericulata]